MRARADESAIGWVETSDSSSVRYSAPLKFGAFLVGGRNPIHELLLIDVNRRGVFLTFAEGVGLTGHETFYIVRPLTHTEDALPGPGRPRRVVAEVEVLEVMDRTRARVRVLDGSVIKGIGAERVTGHRGRR